MAWVSYINIKRSGKSSHRDLNLGLTGSRNEPAGLQADVEIGMALSEKKLPCARDLKQKQE
jgi:hypothetical protein